MPGPAALPVVLLIHGVASTGEWHNTAANEFRGVFQCERVKYRHYHGVPWGPVKIYLWPTALLLLVAASVSLLATAMTPRVVFVFLLLLIQTGIVLWAEWEWERSKAVIVALGLYLVLGTAAWFLEGQERLAALLALLAAVSLFLDLREYGGEHVSLISALAGSLVALVPADLGAAWLLRQTEPGLRFGALAALAVLLVAEPWFRRRRAFRFVLERIQQARADEHDDPPHVVAHSLGTYLTGHLLNEETNLSLGSVIFSGCVLERAFPWQYLVGGDIPQKSWGIRNHVAEGDAVPVLTALLRRCWVLLTYPFRRAPGLREGITLADTWVRWRPLGRAGQAGFHDRPGVVYTLPKSADEPVRHDEKDRAPVHNVHARYDAHSSLNQDPKQQFFHWLPYLWKDDPQKYDYWRKLCWNGNEAGRVLDRLAERPFDELTEQELKAATDYGRAEQMLLNGPWRWPLNLNHLLVPGQGRPLRAYVEEIAQALPAGRRPDIDFVMQRVAKFVFEKVAMALEERKKRDARPEVLAWLVPSNALRAALCDSNRAGAPVVRELRGD